jgi:hypothetical protein
VTDTSATPASAPGGPVSFSSTGSGSFVSSTGNGQCTLVPVSGSASQASCTVRYTQTQQGSSQIRASYGGDSQHATSSAVVTLLVFQPLTGNATCTGVVGGSVQSVSVPAGADCTLVPGTVVAGTVTVNGGTLTITGATVGNITTGQDATVTVTSSTVNGNVQGNDAGTTTITGPCTTIKGNVQQTWDRVQNDANLQVGSTTTAPAASDPPATPGAAATGSSCASGPGSGVTVGGSVSETNANTATVTGPCTTIKNSVRATYDLALAKASVQVGGTSTAPAAASTPIAALDAATTSSSCSGPGSGVTVGGGVTATNANTATVTGPCTTVKGPVLGTWNRVQNVAALQVGDIGTASTAAAAATAATTSSSCGTGPGSGVTVGDGVTATNAKATTVTGPGVMINGTMQVRGGGQVTLVGNPPASPGYGIVVGGNLRVTQLGPSTALGLVCATQVNGNLVWQNNAAPVTIGGPSCPDNAVGGNLQVINNTMPAGYSNPAATIENNTITGNLQVQQNTPVAVVSGNTVGGTTQIS